ncbi:MAG: thioredoxin [Hyphomicrobiales bacterium]|nr:MAG: thioredoxin [Hyphomicrobiales bacterium]
MTDTNGAAAELISDSSDGTFMADVIEASKQALVLVDFWAPWCGPCKQLGPTLEKLVLEAKGAVRLVKINVDENQGIAGQLGVQSIPAVFAFKDGKPVDGFMGALPESEIRNFLKKHGGEGSPEITAALEAGQAALESGDWQQAAAQFQSVLQANPGEAKAVAGLARCLHEVGQNDDARKVLATTPPDQLNDPDIVAVTAMLDLAEQAGGGEDLAALIAAVEADPDDQQARIDLALAQNAAGQREEALETLLGSLERDRNWNEDAARKQLLKFFEAWGAGEPLCNSGRRRLSTILFS